MLENVLGRPVISNCGTATEQVSEFLDYYIQPLVDLIPSVIKDTNDFLRRLRGLSYIPEAALICTIDVVGLYPHIPHCEGLEALKKAIDRGNVNIPTEHLIDLAKLILQNNYFEFNEKIYCQKLAWLLVLNLHRLLPIYLWQTGRNVFLKHVFFGDF